MSQTPPIGSRDRPNRKLKGLFEAANEDGEDVLKSNLFLKLEDLANNSEKDTEKIAQLHGQYSNNSMK